MHVTLGEAARQSGVSKSKISRAIRDGKLSAERSSDTGSYRIEQSELQRYLEATSVTRATVATVAEPQSTTPTEQPDTAALNAQIDGLKQIAELLRNQLTDALQQRDRWQQQAERLALAPPTQEPMTWWRWLRTTG
jgi:excisionase family DNA binding protein